MQFRKIISLFFLLAILQPGFAIDYSPFEHLKMDKDGFARFPENRPDLAYKVSVYLPEELPLIGFGSRMPKMKIVVELKELKGKIRVPADWKFEGMENFQLVTEQRRIGRVGELFALRSFREISDKNYLKLEFEKEFVSLFGYGFAHYFNAGRVIEINGRGIGAMTVVQPKWQKRHIFIDNVAYGNVFEIDELTTLFLKPENPAFVVVDERQKMAVTAVMLVLAALFVVLWKKFPKMPSWKMSAKQLAVALVICLVLSTQLAFFAQEGERVSLEIGEVLAFEGTMNKPSNYLLRALAITRSIDEVVLKGNYCGKKLVEEKLLTAMMHSARKIYVLKGAENGECYGQIKGAFGGKIEIVEKFEKKAVAENALQKLIAENAQRLTFLAFAIAEMLFLAVVIVTAAGLRPKQIPMFAFGAVFGAFAMLFAAIVVGFLAGVPISYHGANSFGTTMASKFLPGILNEAHNFRFGLAVVGAFLAMAFAEGVRRKIELRSILLVFAIGGLLFVVPQTEYQAKKLSLVFFCAECSYDGSLSLTRLQEIFNERAKRLGIEEAAMGFLRPSYREEFDETFRLFWLGKTEEAAKAMEEFAERRRESEYADYALYMAANIHLSAKRYDESGRVFKILLERYPKSAYAGSAEMYLRSLDYARRVMGRD